MLSSSEGQGGLEEQFTPSDITRLVGNIPVAVLRHLEPEVRSDPYKIAMDIEKTFPGEILDRWIGI